MALKTTDFVVTIEDGWKLLSVSGITDIENSSKDDIRYRFGSTSTSSGHIMPADSRLKTDNDIYFKVPEGTQHGRVPLVITEEV